MSPMNKQIVPDFSWDEIETVLLDMDGTLLDKHFDDQFWCHHVPLRYGQKNGLDYHDAHAKLFTFYHKAAGTLNWTDMDYWSREFDLDIFDLKHEIAHLIKELPGAIDFLTHLKQLKKKTVLVTNCHPKGLALKFTQTSIEKYFDRTTCAIEMNASKEEAIFWQRLEQRLGFNKKTTLFIDDNHKVLQMAQQFGMGHLVHVARPSSQEPCIFSAEFPSVERLVELI